MKQRTAGPWAYAERLAREEALMREIRAYIEDERREYAFGGLVNLCTSLATICEQLEANLRCADYGTAATEFKRLEELLDLRYEPGERPE